MSIALRQPIVDRAPYASAAEFGADLATIALSLKQTNAGIVARGRLRALQRAVDVFGFHLAPIDLRQNSDVHERTIAELFAAASPGLDYKALSETERVELLLRELVVAPPARSRLSSLMARRRPANSRSFAPPPRSGANTARARSEPRSSPRRTASPTCWSSR